LSVPQQVFDFLEGFGFEKDAIVHALAEYCPNDPLNVFRCFCHRITSPPPVEAEV
jgi:hypothetical protein